MGLDSYCKPANYYDNDVIENNLSRGLSKPEEIFVGSIDYLNSIANDPRKVREVLRIFRRHNLGRELIYEWLNQSMTEEIVCDMMRHYLCWDEIGIAADDFIKAFAKSEFGSSFAKGERPLSDLPFLVTPEQFVNAFGIKGIVERQSRDFDFLSFILDYQSTGANMTYLGILFLDEYGYSSEHLYDMIELVAHGAENFKLDKVFEQINTKNLSPGTKLYYRDVLIKAGLDEKIVSSKLPSSECYMEGGKHAEMRKYYENPNSFARDLRDGSNKESVQWLILHPEKVEFSQDIFFGIVGFAKIQSTFIEKQNEGCFNNFILELFRAYLWAKWDINFLIDQFFNCNEEKLDEYKEDFGYALDIILTTKTNTFAHASCDFCLQQLPLDESNWVAEALEVGARNKN